MTTTIEPELVAQLNASWRVMLLWDGVKWSSRTWRLEKLVDGEWCNCITTRSADMLRWSIKGDAVGILDAGVPAILAALPARVDIRPAVDDAAPYKPEMQRSGPEILSELSDIFEREGKDYSGSLPARSRKPARKAPAEVPAAVHASPEAVKQRATKADLMRELAMAAANTAAMQGPEE